MGFAAASLTLIFTLFAARESRGLEVGETICVEGFIMDSFCIQRGTLLDNPWLLTLEHPEEHSVHCLVDVGVCRRGPFLVLQKNVDNEFYSAAYQVDEPGRKMLVEDAQLVGQCSTCTGGSGLLRKGYRAEITGIVELVGEGEFKNPHKIQVQSVRSSSFADDTCTAGSERVEEDPPRKPSLRPTAKPTSSLTNMPSDLPSLLPSDLPSNVPSRLPSSS